MRFSDQRRTVIAWFVFGTVGGLGYSLQRFHYICFAMGSAAGLLAMLAVRSCQLSEELKLGVAYSTEFVISFGSLTLPILGARIWNLLYFHFVVAAHSGNYGGGTADVVSLSQVTRAVDGLASMPALIPVFC